MESTGFQAAANLGVPVDNNSPKTMKKEWIIGYYSCYGMSFTPTLFPRDHPFNPQKGHLSPSQRVIHL